MAKPNKPYDFEKTLRQLESLVERMESGKLNLEESLEAFEQGIKLTRECQQLLATAEQRVQKLVSQQGEEISETFNPED